MTASNSHALQARPSTEGSQTQRFAAGPSTQNGARQPAPHAKTALALAAPLASLPVHLALHSSPSAPGACHSRAAHVTRESLGATKSGAGACRAGADGYRRDAVS